MVLSGCAGYRLGMFRVQAFRPDGVSKEHTTLPRTDIPF
jgi:hypothetical protein